MVELLRRVGSSEDWAWLVVEPERAEWEDTAYAQACGDASRGLAVETGFGASTRLVVPRGAATKPLRNVGVCGWHYLAHPDELHTVGDAFAIFADYLIDGTVDGSRYLKRSVVGRGASRVGNSAQ